MELNLQISHISGCLLLAEEILKFSRSVLSHGIGYQALPSPCLLNLGTDAAKLRRALWHMQHPAEKVSHAFFGHPHRPYV
jgi:hypothetical protein